MQQIRSAILKHVRINNNLVGSGRLLLGSAQYMCSSSISAESDHILSRVIDLVKRYDKIDANKVTETADFQKDLSLDSLDRVELVMAIEQEFSIEIPDEKADKFSCCGDVVKYIKTESNQDKAPVS